MNHVVEDVHGFVGSLLGKGLQMRGNVTPQVKEAALLLGPAQDSIQMILIPSTKNPLVIGGAIFRKVS